MRVVVVTTGLEPGVNDLWEAAADQVDELLLVGARSSVEAPGDGTQTVALNEIDFGRGLIWRHLHGLRQTIREFEPDVVHVNGELWGVTAQEAVTTAGKVVVHGAENLWYHGGAIERVIRKRLVDRALSHSAGYVSWNHAGAEHVRRLTSPDFPIMVLPGIIPPSPFRDAQWARGSSEAFRIALVGRLVEPKGFDTVLRAVALLHQREDVELLLCGAGPEEGKLMAMASELGVKTTPLGFVAPTRLAGVLSGSHCLVQPSISTPDWVEQFGRSVAEAISVGLPCLVSDSGELPFLVGKDPDAIFREGDAADLATKLAPLLQSSSTLCHLSDKQSVLAKHLHPEAAAARLVDYWRRIPS